MGTQTSKPLHGDEERRNRFRRPRTPTKNDANTNSSGDNNNNDKTWPCSNCHATVSSQERSKCPYCGGIQVKIRSPHSTKKAINSSLLLERLAATTPTTPVNRNTKELDPSKIRAFLSESATTSTMDYDEEDEESLLVGTTTEGSLDNPAAEDVISAHANNNRPASALSQSSSISQNFNMPRPSSRQHSLPNSPPMTTATSPAPSVESIPHNSAAAGGIMFNTIVVHDRPPDPVALTLEAKLRSGTPSPQLSSTTAAQHQPPQGDSVVTKRKAVSGEGFQVPKKKMVLP